MHFFSEQYYNILYTRCEIETIHIDKGVHMDHSIVLKSYGKINLGLDVLRRREDGYHEVRMIMQTGWTL